MAHTSTSSSPWPRTDPCLHFHWSNFGIVADHPAFLRFVHVRSHLITSTHRSINGPLFNLTFAFLTWGSFYYFFKVRPWFQPIEFVINIDFIPCDTSGTVPWSWIFGQEPQCCWAIRDHCQTRWGVLHIPRDILNDKSLSFSFYSLITWTQPSSAPHVWYVGWRETLDSNMIDLNSCGCPHTDPQASPLQTLRAV